MINNLQDDLVNIKDLSNSILTEMLASLQREAYIIAIIKDGTYINAIKPYLNDSDLLKIDRQLIQSPKHPTLKLAENLLMLANDL